MPAAAAESSSSTSDKDPNEIVCEKQTVTGSRLQVRKVCMTREQWKARKQADREGVDRHQTGACLRSAGC
jgi:hypothetical protein